MYRKITASNKENEVQTQNADSRLERGPWSPPWFCPGGRGVLIPCVQRKRIEARKKRRVSSTSSPQSEIGHLQLRHSMFLEGCILFLPLQASDTSPPMSPPTQAWQPVSTTPPNLPKYKIRRRVKENTLKSRLR